MTDTPDTSPEAVERLIVWLMDAHETGNTEKNPDVWRTLEALSDALEAEMERVENANQAMSETQPSWEYRCHAIMAALGCDYGGPAPDIPEEHTWYARNLSRHKARAEAAEAERDEMTRRRDYWKALAEGQDFTRVYLETCAERDALKAELVSTLSAAILDAQIRVIENRQLDTPDQIRANACAFLDYQATREKP